MVFSTANYQRWLRDGGHDAAERANELARTTLERYERPPLDAGRLAELDEYVVRRRRELGD
jgi:trimethylamine--corrinoid protein Co-methyltransferase